MVKLIKSNSDKNTTPPVVYQANPLVERYNNFNTLETKLFYMCLTQVNPKLPNSKFYDPEFLTAVIPTSEVIEMFGGHNVYYDELKKIIKIMAEKCVTIKTDKKRVTYPVFAQLKWDKEKGLIIEFNKYMQPFLLELANRAYTRIEYEQIWQLSSIYAIRILELVLQYRSIGHRLISLDDLRDYLGIDKKSYKNRINNFKKYVIENPIQEINEKTHFNILYEYKKDGRSVTSVHFFLVDTNKPVSEEIRIELERKERVRQDMIRFGVDEGMANTLLKQYGTMYCQENMQYVTVKYAKQAKNLAGYIVRAIQKDFYGEHRKAMDKELIDMWPNPDDDMISELEGLANNGDQFAQRRLYLLRHEGK